ncbi:MAG: hypothetical protein JSW58_08480 [Candidatus Latescibacterota bacterium]|nr:MAG: hypothetical protein JSW58_08480 [Candidatus Latescibacterota bacterium]
MDEKKAVAKVEKGGALARQTKFAALDTSPDEVRSIVAMNLQGRKVSAFDLARIKVPAGETTHWSVRTLDGPQAHETIEGIVLHSRDLRAFWTELDPTGKPPDCKSDDGLSGMGVRWADDDPTSPHDCSQCKWGQFESDPRGKRGQYCKQMLAIFILMPDTFLPTVIFMPPTSIKTTRDYLYRMAHFGVLHYSAVTRFALAPDKNPDGKPYNRVECSRGEQLKKETIPKVRAYIDLVLPSLSAVEITSDDVGPDIKEEG